MILKSLIFEHWKRFYSETAEVIVGKIDPAGAQGIPFHQKKNWRKTGLKFFFEPENFFFSESNEIL